MILASISVSIPINIPSKMIFRLPRLCFIHKIHNKENYFENLVDIIEVCSFPVAPTRCDERIKQVEWFKIKLMV